MTDQTAFVPPAADGLPPGALDSATEGANRLDAWARDPRGRNFLAHALVQLARDGWLRHEAGNGFEPMTDRQATPEPDPAVSSVGQAPTPDQAAAIASCPGYEAIPNPCRCPCYGCKHHCGAHNPDELTDAAPTPDRTALRQRIAGALVRYDWNAGLSGRVTPSEHHYGEADAVLAVLPEPTDRTAVLREGADAVARDREATIPVPTAWAKGNRRAEDVLRRLADGPAAVVSGRAADETAGEAEAQPSRHRWYVETRDGVADEWAPGTRFTERRAALERYEVLKQHHPTWKDGSPAERRIVRETTSYTVEPVPAVGGAQQPTEAQP